MNRIMIPQTTLSLSLMGCGCAQAGLKWDGKDADYVFDAFFDLGGNLYDSARVYSDWIPGEVGRSERVIGDWLMRSGKRNQVVIATKGGHPDIRIPEKTDMHKNRLTREEMTEDLDLSLKALRTDWIDLYFYHRDDWNLPVEELVETMEAFVKAGKIRCYGCSNWTTERMQAADAYCRKMGYRGFAANQVHFNLGTAHKGPGADDTMVAMDAKMYAYHRNNAQNLVMPYMGLCGGFFNKLMELGEGTVENSEYYSKENLQKQAQIRKIMETYQATITQAVLGFFTCQDFACVPLFGPRNAENLEEAWKTFEIPFEKADYGLE